MLWMQSLRPAAPAPATQGRGSSPANRVGTSSIACSAAQQRQQGAAQTASVAAVAVRAGKPEDLQLIRSAVWAERLNPAGLVPERFLVAEAEGGSQPLGFGQLKPLGENVLELASLVVLPEHRHRGIGSRLIASLVERAGTARVLLLTIEPTIPLYARVGFKEAPPSSLPPFMLAEFLLGTVVARLATGARLVALERAPGASSSNSSSSDPDAG